MEKLKIYDSRGELISWAPIDGQNALNNSVPYGKLDPNKINSTARFGVDHDEVVILCLTQNNTYHGYVPYDHQIPPKVIKNLIKLEMLKKK